MSISRLIRFFSTFSVLPIEIPVVVEQIIEEYDIVDDISIIPLDIPASELKGVHYRFLQRMEPPQTGFDRKVLIGFSRHLTVPWQRVVCCKELIHIMDGTPFRTTTRAGVDRLVPRLLSRSSIAPMGVADLGAIKDIIATYQALAVLFPEEMREHFASQFRAKKITIEKIASACQSSNRTCRIDDVGGMAKFDGAPLQFR